MSKISRRSLLGYSGTAAAGAVLASGATAEAAPKPEGAEAAQAAETTIVFAPGTKFAGDTSLGDEDKFLYVTFSVRTENASGTLDISNVEMANAINQFVQSKGWPALTYYGTVSAPLT